MIPVLFVFFLKSINLVECTGRCRLKTTIQNIPICSKFILSTEIYLSAISLGIYANICSYLFSVFLQFFLNLINKFLI